METAVSYLAETIVVSQNHAAAGKNTDTTKKTAVVTHAVIHVAEEVLDLEGSEAVRMTPVLSF